LLEESGSGSGFTYESVRVGMLGERVRLLYEGEELREVDAEGNKRVLEALKASDKKDHLRADITGEVKGDTISVTSIHLR